MPRFPFWASIAASVLFGFSDSAADTDTSIQISVTNQQKVINLPALPGVDEFKILTSSAINGPFAPSSLGTIGGYTYTDSNSGPLGFYKLQITPKSAGDVLTANVLNRIAYGPTPDEIERVRTMGPEAYIEEQLAPELISETLNVDAAASRDEWQYVTATGIPTTSDLYIYLASAGDVYIDDLKLVQGTAPEVGVNMIKNGDFESALTPPWNVTTNYTNSVITTEVKHSGNASLHVVASAGGTGRTTSIWETMNTLTRNTVPYTLSFWFKPGTNIVTDLTFRLSGSGIEVSPDTQRTKLDNRVALLDDLRAWYVLHAVRSKRQLLEVLLQFVDNHFVTQYSKSKDFFDAYYDDTGLKRQAVAAEYRELEKWRAALLKPACTFYDLLKISVESPAMIIYLDTVNSKGNGNNIANENYARELLELFTFGVDNGYDQNDITILSRAWTGWSINVLEPSQVDNPFAPQSTTRITTVGTNLNAVSNLFGTWSFQYKQNNHNTNSKTIFPGKTVPARFGAPYAGRSYELVLPRRNGTNGIKDGYEVIAHLANQPFTQEFLSVKLCRLFVHEDFATGYDFTDPNLSEEGKLVRKCMEAWESSGGQIRPVLRAIFNSELFRTQNGSLHKIKTPLEFTVSAIRALRAPLPDGSYSSDTDGYGLKVPMARMGSMGLFDRAEPDGWPEAGTAWISAGTLAERLRFVQTTCMPLTESGRADGIDNGNKNVASPTALLKLKVPAGSLTDAGAVADFFLHILFPGEGKANLDTYKTVCVKYLNTSDDGSTSSAFSELNPTAAAYDTRIRGLAAMLMTTQRFQEQ